MKFKTHHCRNRLSQAIALALGAAAMSTAMSQTATFDLPEQDAATGIPAFARQANLQIIAPANQLVGIRTHLVRGSIEARAALKLLLAGTGLGITSDDGRTIVLKLMDGPPPTTGTAPSDPGALEEIVVTAQKRTEDLQKVPISIKVLGGERLEQLQVSSFDDYAKFLSSVSFQSNGPGQAQLYFRGISSGADGSHSGSESATGLYLDETPVTTIGNSIDLHMYDIDRVEALAGPQGTLYGASSLSGTLRILTNKPDPSQFSSGYDLKGDKFGHGGGPGGEFEGFVNIPLGDNAAIRMVGYFDHDGGFISNKYSTLTYQRAVAPGGIPPDGIPADPLTIDNAEFAKKNFNDVDTWGGRAALKVDLDEQWTVTPSVVYQHQKSNGVFSYDPSLGYLQVTDYSPDNTSDRWYQSALVIEGKVSNWNLLYSGGWFQREVDHQYDYSEYAIAYDQLAYALAHLVDNQGHVINPTPQAINRDTYTKQTHEIRISSPADNRFRMTAGAFYQRQTDHIQFWQLVDNDGDALASRNLIVNPALNPTDIYSVDGSPGALYLEQEHRVDHDYALFTDGTFDITDKLKLSAGIRGFVANNSLSGFDGQGEFNGSLADSGEGECLTPIVFNQVLPCNNVDKKVRESGETHRVNLTYQMDPDVMIYATLSTGFRPGGVNHVPYLKLTDGSHEPVPPYDPDTLTNYELGWKSTWFDRRLRFNGALFYEKWKDIQIEVDGANGIGSIFNAGNAVSKGFEGDLAWNVIENLNLSVSGTYLDAKLVTDFCQYILVNNVPTILTSCQSQPDLLLAPRGTRLPVTPNLKVDATARYQFAVEGFNNFVQESILHRSSISTYLKTADDQAIGNDPGFTTTDFSAGTGRDNWNLEVYVENVFDKLGVLERNPQCVVGNCFALARIYPTTPQTFGIRFGQKF
jgi:outer membrane receptor protein involved in Fe transport